jgi:hypothetical protein
MSAGIEITRTEHSPTQLRAMAVKRATQNKPGAFALVLEGASRAEAARQTGMDRQPLLDWVHRFNATGVDGLISRPPSGPTPKLTKAQFRPAKPDGMARRGAGGLTPADDAR